MADEQGLGDQPTSQNEWPLLELAPGGWYGWEMQPGYFGPYFSPIRVRRVTPLKTGNGIIQLDFRNCFYAEGVQEFSIEIRVLMRERDFLIGVLNPRLDGPKRACLISTMSYAWLRSCAPMVLEHARDQGLNVSDDVEGSLNRLFNER